MASPATPGPVTRGIVEAQFVEDVHAFMDGKEGDAVMKPLQDRCEQGRCTIGVQLLLKFCCIY